MQLSAIIESWSPPDEDYQNLLEAAFRNYQIDALAYALAGLRMDTYKVPST